jgi:hypothetical protein
MRVLVAGRNAKALAITAGVFADDLIITTAATKAACIALLDGTEFDLIVACETLRDGSGLEVLSHAAVNTPDTLRIFAARPSTLNLLQGELGLFGLFRTLTYPINFRKLWAALDLARSCCVETEPKTQAQTPGGRHVVLESAWQTGEPAAEVRDRVAPQAPRPAAGMQARRLGNAARAARRGAAVNSGATAHTAGPSQQVQVRQVARASAGSSAQRAPSAAVQTVRTTAAANGSTVAHAAGPSQQTQPRQAARAGMGASAQRAPSAAVQTVRTTAAANGGTVAHAAGPSQQVQVRQVARASAGSSAQRAPSAAVQTVRTTTAANSGTVAHAAGPSRQTQSRDPPAQPRATPTAQRSAHGATAHTAPVGRPERAVQRPAANGGTAASAASAASARTGPAVNTGRAAHGAVPSRQAQPRQVAASHATPVSRRAAAASRQDARIPQTEAFKRAVAKRNAAKLEANTHLSAVDVLGAVQQSRAAGDRGERRREPAMSNDSLVQLARLTTTRRPTYNSRSSGGKKRAAIVVGSGVFAAGTAAVLTFFMLHTNNSIARSQLPLVASIERPVSQQSFPWQPTPQQPTSTVPLRSEAGGPMAADLEVQAEAASDASAVEPGHPGPPPPNPPPGPSEPPSSDSPGWVDE